MTIHNGTPRPTTPFNIEPEMVKHRVRKHLKKYKDDYILFGSGIAVGIVLNKTFRRKPTVDEAAIVQKWMEETAKTGFNIYALGNVEKDLWESTFAWAVKASQAMSKDLGWVLHNMAHDYRENLPHPTSVFDAVLSR